MARETNKLSPMRVAALIKARKPGLYGDGAGLGLRVGYNGASSWVLRYMRQGKAHEMGLGPTHTFGLAEARERARRFRQELHEGIDPLARRASVKAGSRPVVTFGQVAEMYMTSHAPSWRSEVHRQQWRQTLTDYVLPNLGSKNVSEIETDAVLEVVEPLWHVKPETASRVRGRIESIFDYAAARGWRRGDNPARWRGHLDNLLPAPGKVRAVVHHAALDWRKIGDFMRALRQRQGIAARAVEFCVLTATRSSEARGARWDELDLSNRTWCISGTRTKTAKEHRVPLSDAATNVLDQMKCLQTLAGDLIFPGAKAGELSDVALSKMAKLCAPGANITLHGMRSAFRDWAGESTSYPREVIEMALAHRLGDKAEQAYARGDLFQKRRRLMDDWGHFCSSPEPAAERRSAIFSTTAETRS
jgi:integrase